MIISLFRKVKISSCLFLMLGLSILATTFMFQFALMSIDNMLLGEKEN